jgi:hypothetical protein
MVNMNLRRQHSWERGQVHLSSQPQAVNVRMTSICYRSSSKQGHGKGNWQADSAFSIIRQSADLSMSKSSDCLIGRETQRDSGRKHLSSDRKPLLVRFLNSNV